MKEVVVVTETKIFHYKTKKDYLRVNNSDTGELVIIDMKEVADGESRKDAWHNVAVFKNWLYWRDEDYKVNGEKTDEESADEYEPYKPAEKTLGRPI